MKKYFRHKLENLINISKIVTVSYFEFDKNFSYRAESHNFWEAVYVDKGNFFCNVNGKETLIKEGEIIFHKPNASHSHYANGKDPSNVFIISFECKSQAMLFFEDKKIALGDGLKNYLYLVVEEARRTFDLGISNPEYERLKLLKNPTLGGEQLIKNFFEILLVELMRNLTETDKGNSSFLKKSEFNNKFINDIIEILEKKVYSTISINELCQATSYSRAHLFREFKKVTGKTILSYFTTLKIEKSKELLRDKELSISQIAEKLSFDTPNYFSKTFKKITGFTPLQYKKRFTN